MKSPLPSTARGVTAVAVRSGSPRSRALRHVRAELARNAWRAGERLPTEEALAAQIGISRRTMRAAYAQLEREGLVLARGRAGRFCAESRAAPRGILTDTIGLLTEFTDIGPRRFGGLLSVVDSGVVDAVARSGRHLLLIHPDGFTAEDCGGLLPATPLGVVSVPEGDDGKELAACLQRMRQAGAAVVAGSDAAGLRAFDRVAFDHAAGARESVAFLAARGRRRILRVWLDITRDWLALRDGGYEQAVRSAAIPNLPALRVPGLLKRNEMPDPANLAQRARQYAGFLLEHLRGPDAVDALLLTSDSDLFPVAVACRLCGREPGRDLDLVGYDNFWESCWERALESAQPAATVDKQNHACGVALVDLLLERVAGRLPPEPQLRWFAPRLVVPG